MSKFRRELKNVVYNYSDAEAKVREATSNDPWGPSSALMGELAEYTYHVQAYGLVMGMLWKRLNDHGKNWRHVYKALVVLEYLIKTGSERVSQQCKDNMFSIQTLKDFQYVDKDGKDQGANIREKAKSLVALLKDDERLKDERRRGQQARARHAAISSNSEDTPPARQKRVQFSGAESPSRDEGAAASGTTRIEQDVEQARPTDTSEEEMQLKLALQLSKQQAEEEERLKSQEEESLQAAIALSKQETETGEGEENNEEGEPTTNGGDLLLDFDSSGFSDPWGSNKKEEAEPPPSYDDITGGAIADPWGATNISSAPPQQLPQQQPSQPVPLVDPWGGFAPAPPVAMAAPTVPTQPLANADPWGLNSTTGPAQPDPFDLSGLNLPPIDPATTVQPLKSDRVEDQFLGELGQLVNLDLLSSAPPPKVTGGPSPANPFGTTSLNPQQSLNPFDASKAPSPSLNQIAASKQPPYGGPNLPAPLLPVGTSGGSHGSSPILPRHQQPSPNQSYNPFS